MNRDIVIADAVLTGEATESLPSRLVVDMDSRYHRLEQEHVISLRDYKDMELKVDAMHEETKRHLILAKEADEQRQRYQVDIVQLKSCIEMMETKLLISQQSKDDAVKEVESLKVDVLTCKDQLVSSQTEMMTYHHKNVVLTCEVDQLRSEMSPLESKTEQLLRDLVEANDRVATLEDIIKKRDGDIVSLQELLGKSPDFGTIPIGDGDSAAAEKVQMMEKQIIALTDQLSQLQVALSEEQHDSVRQASDYSKEISTHKQQIDYFKRTLGVLNEEKIALHNQITALNNTIAELSSHNFSNIVEREATKTPINNHHSIIEDLSLAINRVLSNSSSSSIPDQSESIGSDINDFPSSMTEMYSKYVLLSDVLVKERSEKRRISDTLGLVLREIQERAPQIEEQRLEFDRLVKSHCHLLERVEVANSARRETAKSRSQVLTALRESEEKVQVLSLQINDLSSQLEKTLGDAILSQVVIDNSLLIAELKVMKDQRLVSTSEVDYDIDHKYQGALSLIEQFKVQEQQHLKMIGELTRQRDCYKILLLQSESRDRRRRGEVDSNPVKDNSNLVDEDVISVRLDFLRDQHARENKVLVENVEHIQMLLNESRKDLENVTLEKESLKIELNALDDRYRLLVDNSTLQLSEMASLRQHNRNITLNLLRLQKQLDYHARDTARLEEIIRELHADRDRARVERDLALGSETKMMEEYKKSSIERAHQSAFIERLSLRQAETEKLFSLTRSNLTSEISSWRSKYETLVYENRIREDTQKLLLDARVEIEHLQERGDKLDIENKELHIKVSLLGNELESLRNLNLKLNYSRDTSMGSQIEVDNEMSSTSVQLELITLRSDNVELKAAMKLKDQHIDQFRAISAANEAKLSSLNILLTELKSKESFLINTANSDIRVVLEELHNYRLTSSVKDNLILEIRRELDQSLSEINRLTSAMEANNVDSGIAELKEALRIAQDCASDWERQYQRQVLLHSQDIQLSEHLKEEYDVRVSSALKRSLDAESALSTLTNEFNSTQTLLSDEKSTVIELRLQLAMLQSQLSKGNEAKNVDELVGLQLEGAMSETARVRRELEHCQKQLKQTRQRLGEVSSQLSVVSLRDSVSVANENDQVAVLKESNSLLRSELERCKKSMESWSSRAKAAEANAQRIEKDLQASHRTRNTEELSSLRDKVRGTTKQIEDLKAELATSQAAASSAETFAKASVSDELAQMKERNSKLNNLCVKLKKEKAEVDSNLESSKQNIEALEAELQQRKKTMDSFQTELAASERRCKETESAMAVSKSMAVKSQAKIKELEEKIFSGNASEIASANVATASRISDLETEVTSLKIQLATSLAETEKVKDLLRQAMARFKSSPSVVAVPLEEDKGIAATTPATSAGNPAPILSTPINVLTSTAPPFTPSARGGAARGRGRGRGAMMPGMKRPAASDGGDSEQPSKKPSIGDDTAS